MSLRGNKYGKPSWTKSSAYFLINDRLSANKAQSWSFCLARLAIKKMDIRSRLKRTFHGILSDFLPSKFTNFMSHSFECIIHSIIFLLIRIKYLLKMGPNFLQNMNQMIGPEDAVQPVIIPVGVLYY